jgi:hypothetical protein
VYQREPEGRLTQIEMVSAPGEYEQGGGGLYGPRATIRSYCECFSITASTRIGKS